MPSATHNSTPKTTAAPRSTRKPRAKGMPLEEMAAATFKAVPAASETVGFIGQFFRECVANEHAITLGLHALTMDDVQMTNGMQDADQETLAAVIDLGAFLIGESKRLRGLAECCKSAGSRQMIVAARVGLDRQAVLAVDA